MNPLLSLSFLSSGPVATGPEPVVNEIDSSQDGTGGTHKFGRLLNQSGEQQHAADRQSFAGFNLANKTKRLATMEGQPTGRPEISLPPVLPPYSDISLMDDSKAGALLGLLDLASQTRLTMTAQAGEKGQVLVSTNLAEGADEAESEASADSLDGIEIKDGKKVGKGEWFILPVYPELAKAGLAVSGTMTGDAVTDDGQAGSDKLVSDKSAAALAASAIEKQPAEQGKLAADNGGQSAPDSIKNNGFGSMSPTEQVDTDQQVSVLAGNNKMAAESVGLLQTSPGTDIAAASKQATQADNPKLPATGQVPVQTGAASLIEEPAGASSKPELEVELKAAATAELVAAQNLLKNSASNQAPNQTSSTAAATEQAGSNQPQSGVTIFDKPGQAPLLSNDGAQGSTLASAAAIADSALARQQRAGMADNANQTKQALLTGNESLDTSSKVDPGSVPAGQRAEPSLSGFGSVLSQAGQSQADAVATRLDATTIASAQQSAERAKAQSVNKSVTEQLKQVNLLAQNAAGQLKERINLMVRQNIQVAEIRLDPADLGQMQIRVNLQQEQASVQFIVQQQHAKELLEQHMPRLREMLQQQGIQLGEGQVQQQRQGDSQASGQRSGNSSAGQGGSEQHGDEQATAVQLDVKLSERLVDYYA